MTITIRVRRALRTGIAGAAVLAVGLATPSAWAALATVPTTNNPTYQTNGRVTASVTVGNVTYLGGSFTALRPAGADKGAAGEVSRSYLAAVNSTTGALLPWSPAANRPVFALAAAPDGSTVYAGGNFSTIDGQQRKRFAAFDTGTGELTGLRADAVGQVWALAATSDTVYLGGKFSSVNGKPRGRLAAVGTDGTLSSWAPSADATVMALALSPDQQTVYAGGDFSAVTGTTAGTSKKHLAPLSAATGDPLPWQHAVGYPLTGIAATATDVYVGGDGSGGHAGSYSTAGVRGWVTQTDGGVQALTLDGGVLYVGGHFDAVCVGDTAGATVGFNCPENKAVRKKLLAVDPANGDLLDWNPKANTALGVFTMHAADGRLHVGGVFTKMNFKPQQGYTSFG